MKKTLHRSMAKIWLALLLGGSALAVERAEVSVTCETVPAGVELATETQVRRDADGAQVIRVQLTNRSRIAVRLHRAALSFPTEFLPPSTEVAFALGGASMFDTPTRVVRGASEPLESRMFLLGPMAGGGYGLVALQTWRAFWTTLVATAAAVTAEIDGEDRLIAPGETVGLEQIRLTRGPDWQGLLWDYGRAIARANGVKPKPDPRYVGWSNWDYYGGRFTAAQVRGNLRALLAMNVKPNLLQIDGGWWSRCGDFLTPRVSLGADMRELAQEIRAAGLTAGLHFDAMRADRDAQIVREHPEYFLHARDGSLLGATPEGRGGRVFWDFSHPGARAYMREVMRVARHDWGYDYFKFDFLKFAFPYYQARALGRTRAEIEPVPHDPGLTSLERSHRALAAFREGAGEEAYFLGCTAEFGPVVGDVDALRAGGDIDPTYSRFSRACMENSGEFFLDRSVFQLDTDYLVVRGREDEDATLVSNPRKTGGDMPFALAEMWAHYAGLFSAPHIFGDNLMILRPERQALLRRALELPRCTRFVPLDFWAHGRDRDDPYGAFLGDSESGTILALFNWSETPRTFRIGGFAPETTIERVSGAPMHEGRSAHGIPELTLAPRSSVVWRVGAARNFETLRTQLRVE